MVSSLAIGNIQAGQSADFAIATPCFQGEAFLLETLRSVVRQRGDFTIDYAVADGGSQDQSPALLTAFAEDLRTGKEAIGCRGLRFHWLSEKDRGMYDALGKAFALTKGRIMAYINCDDYYLPAAFAYIHDALSMNADVHWIKGFADIIDSAGILSEGYCYLYRRDWLAAGIYGYYSYFVPQETVFWRAELWNTLELERFRALRVVGDYVMWRNFAQKAALYSLNRPVAVFRKRPGQASGDIEAYYREMETLYGNLRFRKRLAPAFRLFHRVLTALNAQASIAPFLPQAYPYLDETFQPARSSRHYLDAPARAALSEIQKS